ncbi:Inhibitor of nuclear factor kappa-B kinase subunit alpha [Geodia barretti]|uniref:Inhibitor of nuclear factor kappa-B kinase subunit alpha n=1 Tax=Geodia barretti TaxID=519541 RepID=A0AA35SE35_GEOBA|nr:Inhibitor of nuclear factor kappa-B kinase subunit alpha [Geodia barretti]
MSQKGVDGRWEFEKNIGTGGFGLVKLFTNLETGAKIVLKECRLISLSQDDIDRWRGEMEIIKKLDHMNIVRALNMPAGLDPMAVGDTPCICMEYCDGGDLRQVIYKLTDFGYAKQYDNSSVCTSLVGTVQYVAPEVLKDKQYHSNVDFWGFGVIVFECISGKRPFLHGHPSAGFAWVDCVAKKGDKDIYIYWGDHPTDPVYSSSLPQPHRLCRPFEVLVTTWLQSALHKEPLRRGVKTSSFETAPFLSVMEHNLNTLIVSALCMQTGDVYSYIVKAEDTVEDLKVHIHDSTTVPTAELYLALPNGHMMENREQVSSCIMEGNVGMVYLFSTALDPSFKMMRDTSPAIGTLIVNGDESIPKQERREVYSHTFFHIRQQYHLFERLHKGHKCILTTIHRQCVEVREQEGVLNSAYQSTESLTQHIYHMQQADMDRLRKMVETNGKESSLARTLAQWEQLSHQLNQHLQNLSQLGVEIGRLRQETETYLRLADELKTASERNETIFYDFYQQYVIRARKIYSDAKSNNGMSTVGRMADVLVGAKQQAEKIILETLNGYNFARQYVAMGDLLMRLGRKRDELLALKGQVTELSSLQRSGIWVLLEQQLQQRSRSHQYENVDVTQSMTPDMAQQFRRRSSSASEYGPPDRQPSVWSQLSAELSDSDINEQLEKSLKKITRVISVPENEKLEEENKFLLTRLSSVVEQLSLGSTNGAAVAMESGHHRDSDSSEFRSSWQPHAHEPSQNF